MAENTDFGSLRQLPSGKWQARYMGPDLIRHSAPGGTFDTKPAARAWLTREKELLDKRDGSWSPPREREKALKAARDAAKLNTFSAYCEEFLASHNLRPTTEQEYRRVIKKRLAPFFGAMPLTDITRGDIQAWWKSQPKKTPSANSAAYRILRSILNSAAEDDLIEDAPRAIKRASRAKPRRDPILATLRQLDAITAAMPEHLRLAVVLAYTTGLRQGELLELRRKDIDIKTHTVRVSRAIGKTRNPTASGACKDCGRVIGGPKTEAGKRTVTIPKSVMPSLRAHLLAHAGRGTNGLLFPGATHDHTSVSTLQWHFKKACAKAGIKDLRWHELRHAAMSLAGAENATATQLMRRAGHSSRAAMETYQHADLEQDRLLAERLDATLRASKKVKA